MAQSPERMIPIRLPPGLYKNGTRQQAKGRWYDANCVRWYEGTIGPIGGWKPLLGGISGAGDAGTATGAQTGTTLKDTSKVWGITGGPAGGPIWVGAIVTITGGTGAGQTRTVTTNTVDTLTVSVAWGTNPVGGSSQYSIQAPALGVSGKPRGGLVWRPDNSSAFLGVGTQTNLYLYTGGTLTDVTPAGLVTGAVDGSYASGGYGIGPYGLGPYGTGVGGLTLHEADTWSLDNYGSLMVTCLTSDGKIYKVDPLVGGVGTVATNAPTNNRAVVVTPERFIVALGGVNAVSGGNPDARLVQWADQESSLTTGLGRDGNNAWIPTSTNSAGQFTLATRGRLLAGRKGRSQTFLWTDVEAYAMTFNGSLSVYSFAALGDASGAIGPNAMTVLDNVAFWMGTREFYKYDGALQSIQCDVIDFLQQDINMQQKAKIYCTTNTCFSEVIWFYSSNDNTTNEPNKYVSYNYTSGAWMLGTLARATATDCGIFDNPIYVDSGTGGGLSLLWEHEVTESRTGVGTIFLESGPIEISDVDIMRQYGGAFDIANINRYVPDEKTLGDTAVVLLLSLLPTDTENVVGPFTASAPTNMRARARFFRVRIQEVNAVRWRFGVPKLGAFPGGRR